MKYLNPKYTVENFFDLLQRKSIIYIVLRWFRTKETLCSQGDIDLLIADEHVYAVSKFLITGQDLSAVRIDVYSVSGIYGSSFRKTPYYPKDLADRLLLSRKYHDGGYYVPSSKEYFYSFVFHIVFHKAEKSGLPIDENDTVVVDKNNKYIAEMKKICSEVNLTITKDITLNQLLKILKDESWFPTIEWIRKISFKYSPWLMSLYPCDISSNSIAVFILRSKAKSKSVHIALLDFFKVWNVKLIHFCILCPIQKNIAKSYIRSGKWDKGPNIIGGGIPYSVYVLLDSFPVHPPAFVARDYPYLANYRFFSIKLAARQLIWQVMKGKLSMNCIHSSDDNLEAFQYIDRLFPGNEDMLSLQNQLFNKKQIVPSIRLLKHETKRASVTTVVFACQTSVSKLFYDGEEKYFIRELFAYTVLSEKFKFVPKMLGFDKNRLFLKYIDADVDEQKNLIKSRLFEVADIIFKLWDSGFAHLDLHPGNFLIDKKGDIYLVDYEFLYQYENKPSSILESYDVAGFPNYSQWGIKGNNPFEFLNDLWIKTTGKNLAQIVSSYLQIENTK